MALHGRAMQEHIPDVQMLCNVTCFAFLSLLRILCADEPSCMTVRRQLSDHSGHQLSGSDPQLNTISSSASDDDSLAARANPVVS